MHAFLVGCLRGRVSWFFWTGFLKCFFVDFWSVYEALLLDFGAFFGFKEQNLIIFGSNF
jgi:hypothetical protein